MGEAADHLIDDAGSPDRACQGHYLKVRRMSWNKVRAVKVTNIVVSDPSGHHRHVVGKGAVRHRGHCCIGALGPELGGHVLLPNVEHLTPLFLDLLETILFRAPFDTGDGASTTE